MKLIIAILFTILVLVYAAPFQGTRKIVTGLPDAPVIPNTISSGYIPINEDRKIFYIFVTSAVNPSTAPVMLWTNGGPGCSGLIGAFTEIGPYKPVENGTLAIRKSSWTNFANMLFIEQPAGVGFSINTKPKLFDDEAVALDNHELLKNFFNMYPEFRSNPLYLSSQSYGGHYLPTLAKKIIDDETSTLNFKGFVVGNPLLYLPYRDFGEFATYGYLQMFPKHEFDEYHNLCVPNLFIPPTNPPPPRNPICNSLESKLTKYMANTDSYALNFPICSVKSDPNTRGERSYFRKHLSDARTTYERFQEYFPDEYEPCDGKYLSKYLNRKDVQQALNVDADWNSTWTQCANIDYRSSDLITEMMSSYEYIANKTQGAIRVLIYSGTDDSICSTTEAQFALSKLKLNVKSLWKQWLVDGQLGGYTTTYEKGLYFSTVHGAGHSAPATRPDHVYALIKEFISAN